MQQQKFIIQRVNFSIDIENEKQKKSIYYKVNQLFNSQLKEIVSQELAKIDKATINLVIKTLKVDLGQINLDNIDYELPVILKKTIEEELRKIIHEYKKDEVSQRPVKEAELEAIKYFLLNGFFPWWYQYDTSKSITDIVKKSIITNLQQTLRLFNNLLQNENVRKRILYQIKDDTLFSILYDIDTDKSFPYQLFQGISESAKEILKKTATKNTFSLNSILIEFLYKKGIGDISITSLLNKYIHTLSSKTSSQPADIIKSLKEKTIDTKVINELKKLESSTANLQFSNVNEESVIIDNINLDKKLQKFNFTGNEKLIISQYLSLLIDLHPSFSIYSVNISSFQDEIRNIAEHKATNLFSLLKEDDLILRIGLIDQLFGLKISTTLFKKLYPEKYDLLSRLFILFTTDIKSEADNSFKINFKKLSFEKLIEENLNKLISLVNRKQQIEFMFFSFASVSDLTASTFKTKLSKLALSKDAKIKEFKAYIEKIKPETENNDASEDLILQFLPRITSKRTEQTQSDSSSSLKNKKVFKFELLPKSFYLDLIEYYFIFSDIPWWAELLVNLVKKHKIVEEKDNIQFKINLIVKILDYITIEEDAKIYNSLISLVSSKNVIPLINKPGSVDLKNKVYQILGKNNEIIILKIFKKIHYEIQQKLRKSITSKLILDDLEIELLSDISHLSSLTIEQSIVYLINIYLEKFPKNYLLIYDLFKKAISQLDIENIDELLNDVQRKIESHKDKAIFTELENNNLAFKKIIIQFIQKGFIEKSQLITSIATIEKLFEHFLDDTDFVNQSNDVLLSDYSASIFIKYFSDSSISKLLNLKLGSDFSKLNHLLMSFLKLNESFQFIPLSDEKLYSFLLKFTFLSVYNNKLDKLSQKILIGDLIMALNQNFKVSEELIKYFLFKKLVQVTNTSAFTDLVHFFNFNIHEFQDTFHEKQSLLKKSIGNLVIEEGLDSTDSELELNDNNFRNIVEIIYAKRFITSKLYYDLISTKQPGINQLYDTLLNAEHKQTHQKLSFQIFTFISELELYREPFSTFLYLFKFFILHEVSLIESMDKVTVNSMKKIIFHKTAEYLGVKSDTLYFLLIEYLSSLPKQTKISEKSELVSAINNERYFDKLFNLNLGTKQRDDLTFFNKIPKDSIENTISDAPQNEKVLIESFIHYLNFGNLSWFASTSLSIIIEKIINIANKENIQYFKRRFHHSLENTFSIIRFNQLPFSDKEKLILRYIVSKENNSYYRDTLIIFTKIDSDQFSILSETDIKLFIIGLLIKLDKKGIPLSFQAFFQHIVKFISKLENKNEEEIYAIIEQQILKNGGTKELDIFNKLQWDIKEEEKLEKLPKDSKELVEKIQSPSEIEATLNLYLSQLKTIFVQQIQFIPEKYFNFYYKYFFNDNTAINISITRKFIESILLYVNAKKHVSPEELYSIIQTETAEKNIFVSKSILKVISSIELSKIQDESRFIYSVLDLFDALSGTIEITKYHDLFFSLRNQFEFTQLKHEKNFLVFEKLFYFISVKEKMSYPYFLNKISDTLSSSQTANLTEFYQFTIELIKRSKDFTRQKAETSIRQTTNSIEEMPLIEEIINENEILKALNTKDKEKLYDELLSKKQNWLDNNIEGKIYINNAGLVILWPFITRLFSNLKLLEDGTFKTIESQERAVHFLQYIATGKTLHMEQDLVLNKILCGMGIGYPLSNEFEINPKEIEECDTMLKAVINQWEIIKDTSLNGFRETFIQREGIAFLKDNTWNIKVEDTSVDVLLKKLPWGFSVIKLSFNNYIIFVEWNY